MVEETITKYYVTNGESGISKFDNSNDSMLSIASSKDKSEWIQFTCEEAVVALNATGYQMIRANS